MRRWNSIQRSAVSVTTLGIGKSVTTEVCDFSDNLWDWQKCHIKCLSYTRMVLRYIKAPLGTLNAVTLEKGIPGLATG